MDKLFVEEISRKTGVSVKELNRLNHGEWFHGTTVEDARNIVENGVDAYYNVGKGSDYGPGFYLTAKLEAAESYISKLPLITADGEILERTSWAILRFEFNPFKLIFCNERGYRYKNFPKYNDEFAEFALRNWIHNTQNELPHGYDIIWGVMSDSIPDMIVSNYMDGIISYDEAKTAFKKGTSMKQLCIANPTICSSLTPIIEKEVK